MYGNDQQYNLSVVITASLKNFNKSMDAAITKMESAGSRMKSIGKSMTMYVTAPILGIGAAAVKASVEYEKLRVSLDVLTGSAEAGAAQFEKLTQYAAKTPFQLGDLARTNNMLLGFGLNTEEAFEALQQLGDISALTGANINNIAVAYGQAAGEGRVMTRDLLQFVNNGVPIYKLLEDVTGQNAAALRQMASEGKISFEILKEAMRGATAEGGLFFEGTEKLSRTLGGTLSTLRDNFSLLLAQFGDAIAVYLKPLVDWTTQLLIKLQGLDDETKQQILRWAALAAAIGPVIGALGFLSKNVIPLLSRGLMVLTGAMGPIGLALAGVAAGVYLIYRNWEKVKAFFQSPEMQSVMRPLLEVMQRVGSKMAEVFGKIVFILRTIWAEFGDDITSLATNHFMFIAEVAMTALSLIGDFLDYWVSFVKGDFEGMAAAVGNIFKRLSNVIITTLAHALNTINGMVKAAADFLGLDALSENADQVKAIIAALKEELTFDFGDEDGSSFDFSSWVSKLQELGMSADDAKSAMDSLLGGGSATGADFNAGTEGGEEEEGFNLSDRMDDLADSLRKARLESQAFGDKQMFAQQRVQILKTAISDLIENGLTPNDAQVQALVTRYNEAEEALEKFNTTNTQTSQGLDASAQAAQRLGGMLQQAIVGQFEEGGGFGERLLDLIGNITKRLLSAAAAASALAAVFSIFTGGTGGGFGALFGKVFGSLSGFGAFADGGIVSGPTLGLVGEYSGARTNPEVIAPLDKLKSIIGDGSGGRVEVYGRISGNDILLSTERATNRRNRRRGF